MQKSDINPCSKYIILKKKINLVRDFMCEAGCSLTGFVCVLCGCMCVFRIQLVSVWWNAYTCTFSLFCTAIHHRHPEPGMVDIHGGMVRMCVLRLTFQRRLGECPLKSVSRRLPVKVGLFTFRAVKYSVKYLQLIFTVAVKKLLLVLYIVLSIGCISFNEVWCELFLRSVTQQLLYGLLRNSWLYQGRFMRLGAALSRGTGPV